MSHRGNILGQSGADQVDLWLASDFEDVNCLSSRSTSECDNAVRKESPLPRRQWALFYLQGELRANERALLRLIARPTTDKCEARGAHQRLRCQDERVSAISRAGLSVTDNRPYCGKCAEAHARHDDVGDNLEPIQVSNPRQNEP